MKKGSLRRNLGTDMFLAPIFLFFEDSFASPAKPDQKLQISFLLPFIILFPSLYRWILLEATKNKPTTHKSLTAKEAAQIIRNSNICCCTSLTSKYFQVDWQFRQASLPTSIVWNWNRQKKTPVCLRVGKVS